MSEVQNIREAFIISKKGMKMENKIVCPHCKKTISNNPIINDVQKAKALIHNLSFATVEKE